MRPSAFRFPSRTPGRTLWVRLGALLWLGGATDATGADPVAASPPPFLTTRYDEDYRYLADPTRRTSVLDRVKYLPLNSTGSWYGSLGGELRERYEYYDNWNWGLGPQDPNGFWLQRILLSADVHYEESFRVFGQLMSALEEGRIPGPRPTDEDVLDLHQGFAEARHGLGDGGQLTARVGRQEIYFGSQRLVSVREAPNIRLSFDGVRLMYQKENLRLDALATKPVSLQDGVFDNTPNPDSTFWGLYGVTVVPFLPGTSVDFYCLGLERDRAVYEQGVGREVRHSLGLRVWGKREAWDYNVEGVYQFGTFANGTIAAWTLASDTGYRWATSPLKPRLFLRADVASGDRSPENPSLNTFNALFPKGAYFSESGLLGPANLIDVHPGVELQLTSRLAFTADWDFFWRQSSGDGLYNNALQLVRPGAGNSVLAVGNQVQALVQWSLYRNLTATAVYAHFFAGDFFTASPPGKDVNFVSVWMTFRF